MRFGVAAAVAFALVGTAVLTGLGVWQVQRLGWKEALIARLDTRLSADPAPLPDRPDPEEDAFLRVAVEGETSSAELHLLTSLQPWGPGFRVIAPLRTAEGRRILVDLGFVPEVEKSTARPPQTGLVTGALYWPDEADAFTPTPDSVANIWFARDLLAMAAALGTEPLLIIAESHPVGESPTPLRLGVNLPNDHLQYAITWFALALVWAVMGTMLVRREQRRRTAS